MPNCSYIHKMQNYITCNRHVKMFLFLLLTAWLVQLNETHALVRVIQFEKSDELTRVFRLQWKSQAAEKLKAKGANGSNNPERERKGNDSTS